MNCQNLKSITLPEGLEHTGDNCFSGSGINEVFIPKTVKSIGEDALPSFSQANVEKDSKDDGSKVEGGVSVIDGVARIPDGTKAIAKGQFKGQNVCKVVVPKSVEEIQSEAFCECRNLKEVVFEKGSGLKTIGKSAFQSCINLKRICFPEGLESIGQYCFS